MIAYFEIRALPDVDPAATPRQIPARPGHEVEQWDALIAATDPGLYELAAHDADGTVCGPDDAGVAS